MSSGVFPDAPDGWICAHGWSVNADDHDAECRTYTTPPVSALQKRPVALIGRFCTVCP